MLVLSTRTRSRPLCCLQELSATTDLCAVGRDGADVRRRQPCGLERRSDVHQQRCLAAICHLHGCRTTLSTPLCKCIRMVAHGSSKSRNGVQLACSSSPSLPPSSPPSARRRRCPGTRRAAEGPPPEQTARHSMHHNLISTTQHSHQSSTCSLMTWVIMTLQI